MMEKKIVDAYLIRGLTRESGHWNTNFIDILKTNGFREVHLIDLPGTGQLLDQPCPNTVSLMVERARSSWEDHFRDQSVMRHLIGLSLGGMAAMEWVAQFPDDFMSLTVINSSLAGLSKPWQRLSTSAWPTLLEIGADSSVKKKEEKILTLSSNRVSPDSPEGQEILNQWTDVSTRRKLSVSTTLLQLVAAIRYHGPDPLHLVNKMLVMGTKKDKMVDPSCSQIIAEHYQAPFVVSEEAGHDLTLDEPEWAAIQIAGFLNL